MKIQKHKVTRTNKLKKEFPKTLKKKDKSPGYNQNKRSRKKISNVNTSIKARLSRKKKRLQYGGEEKINDNFTIEVGGLNKDILVVLKDDQQKIVNISEYLSNTKNKKIDIKEIDTIKSFIKINNDSGEEIDVDEIKFNGPDKKYLRLKTREPL